MISDTWVFIIITAACLIAVVGFSYFMTTKRGKMYIVYADNNLLKTFDKTTYQWTNLQSIKLQNKFVAGQGTAEMNFAIVFYFANGAATIDRKSNIYGDVYKFSEKLQVPKSKVVTKGLIYLKK
jgi:ABC-type uncharacterized transport system permease subunit